jgi:hypothetical protein
VQRIHTVDTNRAAGQGRKRALLVGINYFNSPNQLRGKRENAFSHILLLLLILILLPGCINDVQNMKQFLISLYGFRAVCFIDDFAKISNSLLLNAANAGGYGHFD